MPDQSFQQAVESRIQNQSANTPQKETVPITKQKETDADKKLQAWYDSVIKIYGPAGEAALQSWVSDKDNKLGVDFKISEGGEPMAEMTDDGKLHIMGTEVKKAELIRKFMMSRASSQKTE